MLMHTLTLNSSDLAAFISNVIGNATSITVSIWIVVSFVINKLEIAKAIIGVALVYVLTPFIGATLLSFTTLFIENPEKSLVILMFVSTLIEEIMKCVLYLMFFKGIQRVPSIVFFGLLFGLIEVFLVENSFSYAWMFRSNLHFFLHPSFMLILYYIANREGFKNQRTVLLGILLATTTHLLNNFLGEYVKWLYPYFFSALMIFSYVTLRSEMKRPIFR
jgi:hypothetical protein